MAQSRQPVQVSQASDLISRLSMSQSMSKQSNLQLMAPDGTVIELSSQGSAATSSEASPNKGSSSDLNKVTPPGAQGIANLPWAHSFSVADAAVTTASRRDDFEEDFGYLVFHEKELANSFETEKTLAQRKLSNQLGSNQTAALSTRSGTESERAQWL